MADRRRSLLAPEQVIEGTNYIGTTLIRQPIDKEIEGSLQRLDRLRDNDEALREQLRTALTALDTVTNQASRGEAKIRRLTAVLREIPEPPSFAGKGLIAEIEALIIIETRDGPFAAFVADWLLRCPDALREARALVEMGVSDG